MALSDDLKNARDMAVGQAESAMKDLADVAGELDLTETVERLEQANRGLKSDAFNVIICGRYRTGKSSLANVLLGKTTHPILELTDGQGPMPVGDLPTTATLTSITYSEQPFVRLWRFDGGFEDWSFSRYLEDSTVRLDEEENREYFSHIRQFEVGLPAELCRAGVNLLDSPGTADVPARTMVTAEAIERCDAAILVFRSDVLASQDERELLKLIEDKGTRVFTVVNMRGMATDEKFLKFSWNRLVKDGRGGPAYAGQEFADHDIYLVDVLKAQQGRASDDAGLLSDSGLPLFEQRLAQFLLRDRQFTHLNKFLGAAEAYGAGIEQAATQRRAAIERDQQQLEAAYQAIQPQLAAIAARRDKLPPLVERYRREAERELKASFEQMIARLRQDLPGELLRRPLPGWKEGPTQIFNTYRQRKLCEAMLGNCNAVVAERLESWRRDSAEQVLEPIISRLMEELADEVMQIERAYEELHFQLTGWSMSVEAARSVVSTRERVLAGVAGLVIGDFSTIFGAGGGGFRSVAGAAGGQIVTGVVMGVLGITGAAVLPIAMAAGIAGALVAGNLPKDRIINKTLERVDPVLAAKPAEMAATQEAEVRKHFDRFQADVMARVTAAVEQEERNFEELVEVNRRAQADKAQLLAGLDAAIRRVAEDRKTLAGVLITVRQTT